jgi:hypothetical protein
MKANTILAAVCILLVTGLYGPAAASGFDHSQFDRILNTYVNDTGLVDYNGIAGDPAFRGYMEALAGAKPDALSRDGQLAFWINAYNAVTIDKVIKWKPEKSVRETLIPGIWTSTKFFTSRDQVVAGKQVSPDDIENDILRKQFKDPRIHFAIVCASLGCPPLPRWAYTAENVQSRLTEETRKYLNSSRGLRIDKADNKLYLSKLFDWFAGDFKAKSGSVLNFITQYVDEGTRAFLQRAPQIAYLDYNWALNAQQPLK